MDDNKGNFIATLQLMAKDNSILQKHLLNASNKLSTLAKVFRMRLSIFMAVKLRAI